MGASMSSDAMDMICASANYMKLSSENSYFPELPIPEDMGSPMGEMGSSDSSDWHSPDWSASDNWTDSDWSSSDWGSGWSMKKAIDKKSRFFDEDMSGQG